ncbi:hypothetical protein COCON_G00113570 [Conger conger]|uniref:Membrane insertase YidC/Oxa/ALB C-terminal domain-containing protein n=1 Tax=Conger conger TaxID=82655 RepID=A0A9Q1HXE4_CONCO|nr:hypothetical protein COCON_G00113570 [Conger conger]
MSFFIGLRQMAYLPVPSMQSGGLWWFTDLTAADPVYILPVAVTLSMFAIVELGAESGVDNPNLRAMKTVFRVMPLIILPLTISFPTAVFTYWLTSNLFSLGQVALLKHPAIRQRLRIPERITHPPPPLPPPPASSRPSRLAGQTLSSPNSWRREKGGLKITWISQPKVLSGRHSPIILCNRLAGPAWQPDKPIKAQLHSHAFTIQLLCPGDLLHCLSAWQEVFVECFLSALGSEDGAIPHPNPDPLGEAC